MAGSTADQSVEGSKETSSEKDDDFFTKYNELLRPCSVYKDEYKECKSIRGRFNQYFIYGESLDCEQWRNDHNNCQKYSWLNDKEAAKLVIQSEMKRRAERLKAHYANDIWTKRENPPEDWVKPLPAFMEERNKNTYLELRTRELKEQEEKTKQNVENTLSEGNKSSFCTFM